MGEVTPPAEALGGVAEGERRGNGSGDAADSLLTSIPELPPKPAFAAEAAAVVSPAVVSPASGDEEPSAMSVEKVDRSDRMAARAAATAERTAARAAKSGLPKAPKTAYNFFAELRRHEVIAANPGAKPPIISRLLGEAWRTITAAQAAPFKAQAATDRQRYLCECAASSVEPWSHKRKESPSTVAVANAVCPALSAVDFYAIASTGSYDVTEHTVALFAALPEDERSGF